MGVAASDGRFEGQERGRERLAKFVNLVAESVILRESKDNPEVTISQRGTENVDFVPKRHLTSVTWFSGPQSAIVTNELVIQPNSQTEKI